MERVGDSKSLFKMSCKFCWAALDAFEFDKKEFFLVNAGVALEQLAKAYLASLDRTLVAEGDFDSLLHASGHSRHAHRPPQRMRSISMKEALDRCGQLLPGIMQLDDDLQLLREVRNGVAHLGLASERADDLLVPFLQASELLLAELDESDWVYFGNKKRWVDETLARDRKDRERDVNLKIGQAKKTFSRRYQSMDHAWKDEVLKMRVLSYGADGLQTHLRRCPACGTDGLVSGTVSPDYDVEVETKHGETTLHPSLASVDFFADRFECKACGLSLRGRGEIEAAGMRASWELLEGVDEQLLVDLLRELERGWDEVP
jgi:hypothetical protein